MRAPACYLGMGLFLAWTVGNSFILGVGALPALDGAREVELFCSMASNMLVLFVIAAKSREIGSLATRGRLVMAMALCATLGPGAMMGAALVPEGALLLLAIGAGIRGAGAALFFMAWSELYSRLPIKQTSIFYSASYLISVALEVAMRLAGSGIALGVELCLPLASALLLRRAVKTGQPELGREAASQDAPQAWTFPYKPLLLTMAYTFTAFFFRNIISGTATPLSWIGGGIVAGLCLLASLLLMRWFDASKLQNAALPLMIAGILLWVLLGSPAESAVMMLTDAGNIAFRIFILVMVCNICYRYAVPALWLFAVVRIAMLAAETLGICTGLALAEWSAAIDQTVIDAFAFALVLVLATVSAFATGTGRDLASTSWHIVPRSGKDASRAEQLTAVMGTYEMLIWRCSKIARLYGLTHREEEVLGCLTKGMTNLQIQKELFISEGTARTHIRHIYEKLGVHSRDEAADIVRKAE